MQTTIEKGTGITIEESTWTQCFLYLISRTAQGQPREHWWTRLKSPVQGNRMQNELNESPELRRKILCYLI